ncbi:hypothetical protein CAEBREN_08188 [Caenorhabditis brenneri]|uniref:SET domain-containing protein n=1 Tax=Caenorhabditis brenneri TaxID=135651 RepID=G0MR34_CAEBE|nr:hypothetical protein CAEBREN_08188 [Caenorhabditis brenneri]
MSYPSSSSSSPIPLSNIYSDKVANVLCRIPETSGALSLLDETRRLKKARRMLVAEHVYGLVTTEPVLTCQMIHEMTGLIVLSYEIVRKPGGNDGIFLYDGLMRGSAGEHFGSREQLLCFDTKVNGNDTKHVRRSCHPNALLKHVVAPEGKLGVILVASEDISKTMEVTLPFDADWRDSNSTLECSRHKDDMELCQMEKERRALAADRSLYGSSNDLNGNEKGYN